MLVRVVVPGVVVIVIVPGMIVVVLGGAPAGGLQLGLVLNPDVVHVQLPDLVEDAL